MQLNEKQKIFCKEYIKDFNATRAALAAGYSEKTASSLGNRLLKNVKIDSYISQLITKRNKRVEFDAAEVLRRLAILARGSVKPFTEKDEFGGLKINVTEDTYKNDDLMYLIDEVTTEETPDGKRKTKLKLASRLKALELAGKHTKVLAFIERIGGDENNPVAIKNIERKVIDPKNDDSGD